jgi:predicted DNA-binding transcriptional regulator AlpA
MSGRENTPSVYESRGLITVKQFAELVGQHPLSVYRRIRKGSQPGAVRVGGNVRIDIRIAIRTDPPSSPV